jgi:hypothetical protein
MYLTYFSVVTFSSSLICTIAGLLERLPVAIFINMLLFCLCLCCLIVKILNRLKYIEYGLILVHVIALGLMFTNGDTLNKKAKEKY